MTDKELLKLIEDCCNDIFDRLEPLANVKSRLYESLKSAINYTHCCTELKTEQECYKTGKTCIYKCKGLCKDACQFLITYNG